MLFLDIQEQAAQKGSTEIFKTCLDADPWNLS